MADLKNIELANALTFGEATELLDALNDALSAMASYSKDAEKMLVVSHLRNLALIEQGEAMNRERRAD